MPRLIEFTLHHPLLIGIAGLLVVAIAVDSLLRRFRKYRMLSPAEGVLLVNKGALVLDLRPTGEFEAGHVIGARHVPATELEGRLAELDRHKEQAVLLTCKTGAASETAAAKLVKAGFKQVSVLKGGLSAWQQEHFPLERG